MHFQRAGFGQLFSFGNIPLASRPGLSLECPATMRLFAIGDIHGHLTALDALLAALPAKKDDLLIFLGDYVDKGPDVHGVLERLIEIGLSRPNTIFLRGNHDQLMIDAHRNPSLHLPTWECLSGGEPLRSYGPGRTKKLLKEVPDAHWTFLEETCSNYHETDHFLFVHAGLRPDRAPAEESLDTLLWQKLTHATAHQSGRTVICGHTAQKSGTIADLGHTICIDTAISKGGTLTALALDRFEFWQASPEGEVTTGKLDRE